MHDISLISTLAGALAAALAFGVASQHLGLSPIVGYLLAGVAIGPHTPGFVADAGLASQLAEIGVILLMFGVGLHFHLDDLLAVRSIAVPGAIVQSLVAAALGTCLALVFGWELGSGIVLGIGLSVASTVVLLRILTNAGELETTPGRIAVGWLVVEDLLTILVLILLPSIATLSSARPGLGSLFLDVGKALLKVAVLVAILLIGGGRAIPWLLSHVARTRSRELFTLTILSLALSVAVVSSVLFGVSMALGAFLAGMVVGGSRTSHQAAADALPMRDAFAVLFFVSVGMLFDPRFVVEAPGLVLGALAIILLAKPLAALLLMLFLRHSLRTALTVAIGLAQIGEFSFILADLGSSLDLLPSAGQSLLVSCALLSITLNPILFRSIGRIEGVVLRNRRLRAFLERGVEVRRRALGRMTEKAIASLAPKTVRAVVVGFGPVGQTVSRILRDFGIEPVIVDLNIDTVTRLVRQGTAAIYGDASRAEILSAAGIETARYLVVTLPDLPSRIPVIIGARDLNPGLQVFVRARYLGERAHLEDIGAAAVCYEEVEAAVGLAEFLLRAVGADEARIRAESVKIHAEFALQPPRSLF